MNNLQKAIEEIENEISDRADGGTDYAVDDLSDIAYRNGMMFALNILRRNLAGRAWADVASGSLISCDCALYDEGICKSYRTKTMEHGYKDCLCKIFIGDQPGCPAFVFKNQEGANDKGWVEQVESAGI